MFKTLHKMLGLALLALATTAQAQKTVPYSFDFTTLTSATDFIDSEWTVLDASEKTGKTWTYGSCYTDNGSISDMNTQKDYNAAVNDYLVSPAITLEAGKTYEVKTLTALLSSLDMALTLEIGTDNTDASTFTTVATLTPEDKGYDAEATKTSELTVAADGTYYLAIFAKSESTTSARAHAFLLSIEEKAGSEPEPEPETPVALPYAINFGESQADWSVLDASETAGTSWKFEADYGFYDKDTKTFKADVMTASGDDYNDYYVSPAFQLEAGKSYTVKTLTAFNNSNGALDLSLVLGTSRTDAATYSPVATLTPLVNYYDTDYEESFAVTVEESGLYHFAFLAKTVNAEASTLAHLFTFAVEETAEQTSSSVTPPYSIDFREANTTWTALDASTTTGSTWGWTTAGYMDFNNDYTTYPCIAFPADWDADANDYYVSPAMRLKGGASYTVDVTAAVYDYGKAKLSLAIGTDKNDASTFTEVGDISVFDQRTYDASYKSTQTITVTEDGTYYLAIHAQTTDSHDAYAYLFNFAIDGPSVEETVEPAAPKPVKRASATMTEQHQVALVFTAPKRDVAESELAENVTVEVYEGETLVKTIADVAPTAVVADTLTGVAAGDHTYALVVKAGELASDAVTVSVTTTPVVPGAVTDFAVEYVEEYGYLGLEWYYPTKDTDGHALAEDAELKAYVYVNGVLSEDIEPNPMTGSPAGYGGADIIGAELPVGDTVISIVVELDGQQSEAATYTITVTGINGVSVDAADGRQTIYTIGGQKVSKATKGLYIINGKKVVVK